MRKIIVAVLDAADDIAPSALYQHLSPIADWKPEHESLILIQHLPRVFKQCLVELEKLITQYKPNHLLLLAQHHGNKQISLEKVALNINDAALPDSSGQQPKDTLTAQHGPAAYFSNLPVAAITNALRENAIPAQLSYCAGTCVSNHAFYGLMHYIKHQNINLHGGLMLVPLLPQQACQSSASASISNELVVSAVKTAINVCLAHDDNMLRSASHQV